jgi:hypothetical protein
MTAIDGVSRELLSTACGGTTDEQLARIVAEINAARPLASVGGWSDLLPFVVKQAWDRLDLTSKVVAYVAATEEESDDS